MVKSKRFGMRCCPVNVNLAIAVITPAFLPFKENHDVYIFYECRTLTGSPTSAVDSSLGYSIRISP